MDSNASSYSKLDVKWSRRARIASYVGSVLPALMAIAVVTSWLTGGTFFQRINPAFPAMALNTAVLVFLMSTSLFCAVREEAHETKRFTNIRILTAGLVLLVALSMALEFIFKTSFGMDQILNRILTVPFRPENLFPGRPPPETLTVFILISFGLLTIDSKGNSRGFNASNLFIVTALLIPCFVLTTYFLSGFSPYTPIYPIRPFSGMSLPAASSCLFLCVGTLCARVDFGFMPLLLSSCAGGRMARATILTAFFSPILLALALSIFSKIGLFGAAAAQVLGALATIFILLVISWKTSRQVEASEMKLLRTIEARERLLAIVSHDLKNPVRTILMSAELIKRKIQQKPDCADYATQEALQGITESAAWAQRLISDLLISQKDSWDELHLELKSENLASIIAEIESSFRPIAKKQGIRLHSTAERNIPPVSVDRKRIFQALSNLIGNALQFTPRGSSIFINASVKDDRQVEVVVNDTGTGINSEHLDKVFLPFWQSRKNSPENLGLGLSIVQKIVLTHGGQIAVGNRPEGGARVAFTIPLN